MIDETKRRDGLDQPACVKFEAVIRAVGWVINHLPDNFADEVVLSEAPVREDAASGR